MNYLQTIKLVIALSAGLNMLTAKTQAQPASTIETIDQYLQARLAKSSIPGLAIAIVRPDTVLFAKGYGVTGSQQAVTANTPFGIASLSKAFTAMAVMQLVEAGKINLEAPVITYIPSFQLADEGGARLTVSQLLHQTSGLADTGFPELAFTEQPGTLDEAIVRLKTARLVSFPGKQFHYHNPNYQILAKIVEAVSHEKFSDYLQKHIFQSLGMYQTRDVAVTQAFAHPSDYLPNGHIFVLGQPIARQEPAWFIDGAAGVISNVNDLARWLRLQLNNGHLAGHQLLDSLHITMTHQVAPGATRPYGMGWFLTPNKQLYHSGILWTYSAEQLLVMRKGYGIVILFNGGLNPFVDYHSFLQGVDDILAGQNPFMPTIPDWTYPVCVGMLLVILIGLAIRRLFRLKQWHHAIQQRRLWKVWLLLFIRLLPLLLVLLIPQLITLLSGRVLNWERIFLMLPDVIAGMVLIALLNLLIVITRVRYLLKH